MSQFLFSLSFIPALFVWFSLSLPISHSFYLSQHLSQFHPIIYLFLIYNCHLTFYYNHYLSFALSPPSPFPLSLSMFWILSVYGCSYNRSFVGQTNWQKRYKNLEIKKKFLKKKKNCLKKLYQKLHPLLDLQFVKLIHRHLWEI